MSRVLIVDDDPQIRRLVRMVLEDEGHEVCLAADGREALDLLPAANPEVIVLDMHMPELDGPGFIASYRAAPAPCAPIVLMSGERGAHIESLGAAVILPKPFDLDDLVSAVRTALD